jgi:two-component system response regulator
MSMSIRTTTILLVEDNPDDEALTVRAFRKSNLSNDVIVAHDGVEALEYLFAEGAYADRDPREVPNLVLLDIKLPKLDGLEVLQRIRENEHTHMLPVVMLTSSKEQDDLARSYSLGANSYIRKPVDFAQFMTAIQQLGLYWLVLNERPPGT